MSMYTELKFNSRLKKNIPKKVVQILEFMTNKLDCSINNLPKHDLFGTERWEYMLSSDSYYFDSDTLSSIKYDDITQCYFLNIQCNFKNYNDEVEEFLDWILPYCDKKEGDFLGYYRCEIEYEPTLIYKGHNVAKEKGKYNI